MALGLRFRNQGHRPRSAVGLTRRLHTGRHDTMPAFGGDDITRHRNYSRGTERTWPECRVRFILTPGDSATISPSSDGNRVREPASFATGRNSVSGDGRECGQTGTDKSRKDQMNRPGQADQDLPHTPIPTACPIPASTTPARACVYMGVCSHYPPLPCRASPPQGGDHTWHDLRFLFGAEFSQDKDDICLGTGRRHLADLPPCGGDARQGIGGISSLKVRRPLQPVIGKQRRMPADEIPIQLRLRHLGKRRRLPLRIAILVDHRSTHALIEIAVA